MSLANTLRSHLFWVLDALKGNGIKHHLKDIEHSFGVSSFELLQRKNAGLLNELLSLATKQTEFYKKYANFKSLEDFPVVNKAVIKNNFDQINILPNNTAGVIKVSTSGSTGTPFRINQTQDKKTRNTADTLYFADTSGFKIGHKLLYLRLWAAYYKKPYLLAYAQNINQIDVEELTDDYLEKLIKKLQKDKSPKGWLGYPSGFEKICNYLEKISSRPIEANIQSIIAMSEPLSKEIRDKMAYYFKNPVVSRYSNVENGIIAQQLPNEDNFTINWASYHVELLDLEKDIPVKLGQLGRIVVTDLYNKATPMIRYDTGDVGSFIISEKGFPVFNVIQGRITDILRNPKGEIVNPFVIYNNLYRFPELNQVQLIQKATNNYLFKLNIHEEFQREQEFIAFFKTYLGEDANINTEYVNDIPLLKSGKRKIIVSMLK